MATKDEIEMDGFFAESWARCPSDVNASRDVSIGLLRLSWGSDRANPVPDDIWDEAARHYDESALASLIIQIALINLWNRINVSTRQVAGRRPLEARR